MAKKVILLVHSSLVPPQMVDQEPDRFQTPWITEYDVKKTLESLGYAVTVIGVDNSLIDLHHQLTEHGTNCVFNLLEEFSGDPRSDYKVVSYLELLGVKYSGCNSKGLLLARDKALCKKLLKHHKIPTPNFLTFPRNKRKKIPKTLRYPAIVKCLYEEASYGIAQASVVHSPTKLIERINFIHENLEQDAIVEDFIPGKEIFVGVMGEKNLTTLPLWELRFKNTQQPEKEIYTSRAKWNQAYRLKKGIESGPCQIPKQLQDKIIKICKKTYRILQLNGYARIDLRVTPEGKVFVLEANPNPNIAMDDEFARSAHAGGIEYPALLQSLLP